MNADTSLNTGYNLDLVAAQDGFNKALYTVTYTNSTGATAAAGASSGTGNLSITIGTGNDGEVETSAFAVTNGSTQANFVDEIVNAFNQSGDYTAAETGGNTNAFYVTKHVSGSGLDRSPMVSLSDFPSITFNTAADTTTAYLADSSDYTNTVSGGVTFHSATASEQNAAAEAANLYSLTSTKSLLTGVRVTLVNEGVGAMSAGTFVTPGSVSNGAIASASTSVSAATNNILVAGTNLVSYVAKSATVAGTEAVANYVAAYTAISSGTSRTTTAGVTAVVTNRTGW